MENDGIREGARMVFVGIDHGTTAIRVAVLDKGHPEKARTFELFKKDGPTDFMSFLRSNMEIDDIELIAVAYSMGDAIGAIRSVSTLKDRGVLSLEGIGPMTGIGTKMFDAVAESGLPAIALPGLHRKCGWLDPRFTILQSHISSPKKVAASYHCYTQMTAGRSIKDAIVTNLSSNCVTILIKGGHIVGGIDACIGAPGLRHGPIDVEAIRRIDGGLMTANEAFSKGGILRPPLDTSEKMFEAVGKGNTWARQRIQALIMAVIMEISGLLTAAGGVDTIAITGALGELTEPMDIGLEVSNGLGAHVHVFSRFSAAIGAAEMAVRVKAGDREILGIPVDVNLESVPKRSSAAIQASNE